GAAVYETKQHGHNAAHHKKKKQIASCGSIHKLDLLVAGVFSRIGHIPSGQEIVLRIEFDVAIIGNGIQVVPEVHKVAIYLSIVGTLDRAILATNRSHSEEEFQRLVDAVSRRFARALLLCFCPLRRVATLW